MGWDMVWRLAMKQFAAEPIELRIVIGLALAFFALMIVVGIRHAFHPAGPKPEPRVPEPPRPLVFAAAPQAAAVVAPVASAKPQPFRARKPVSKPVLKAAKEAGKPYAPMRPQIRRQAIANAVRGSRV